LARRNTYAIGNTTQSQGKAYVYDFENHLIRRNGMTYTYDGDGHRASKTVFGLKTTYATSDINPTGYSQVLQGSHSTTSCGSENNHTYIYGLKGCWSCADITTAAATGACAPSPIKTVTGGSPNTTLFAGPSRPGQATASCNPMGKTEVNLETPVTGRTLKSSVMIWVFGGR